MIFLHTFLNCGTLQSHLGRLPDGKIVIAGSTAYTSMWIDSFYLPCGGCHVHDSDFFLAVLDSTGQALHARRIGGLSYDYGHELLVSSAGDIYLTGSYYDELDLGITILDHLAPDFLAADAFLIKFDTTLAPVWAAVAQGASDESGTALAEDQDGHIIWGGEYKGANITVGDTAIAGTAHNGFIARVTPGGTVQWVQNFAGNGNGSRMRYLTVDEDNTIWAALTFAGQLTYGGETLVTPTSLTTWEGALVGLDAATGAPRGHYVLTGDAGEGIHQVQPLGDHRLMLAGWYSGTWATMLNMTLTDSLENAIPYFWAYLDYPAVPTSEPARADVTLTAIPNPLPADQPLTLRLPEHAAATLTVFRTDGRLYGRLAARPGERTLQVRSGYFEPGVYWIKGETELGEVLVTKIVVW